MRFEDFWSQAMETSLDFEDFVAKADPEGRERSFYEWFRLLAQYIEMVESIETCHIDQD